MKSSEKEEKNDEAREVMVNIHEEVEVIADQLQIPWSIEKHNDTFFLTERPGAIVKIEGGNVDRQEVKLKKKLATAQEAGLLGFVLSPDFEKTKTAYAYYTYEDSSGQFNRIVTLTLKDDVWTEEKVLLDRIPSGSWHHGGRLKIGPDEKLYATAGDAYIEEIAQDVDSLGGKILRLNLDGSIPSDNPIAESYIYSYGHRNPQGLTWDEDGTLYSSEHGNNANEEINRIEVGKNYGWPIIEGNEEQEGMVTPIFTSGPDKTWAPSGMDMDGDKLYVAALRGTALLEFDMETGQYREVVSDLGRLRDVFIEDEYLYFISNNTDGRGSAENKDDKLYRISLSILTN
nr:PQQ-dependent sugar dehydrogenase [Ornithinibacillus halophilus]